MPWISTLAVWPLPQVAHSSRCLTLNSNHIWSSTQRSETWVKGASCHAQTVTSLSLFKEHGVSVWEYDKMISHRYCYAFSQTLPSHCKSSSLHLDLLCFCTNLHVGMHIQYNACLDRFMHSHFSLSSNLALSACKTFALQPPYFALFYS